MVFSGAFGVGLGGFYYLSGELFFFAFVYRSGGRGAFLSRLGMMEASVAVDLCRDFEGGGEGEVDFVGAEGVTNDTREFL